MIGRSLLQSSRPSPAPIMQVSECKTVNPKLEMNVLETHMSLIIPVGIINNDYAARIGNRNRFRNLGEFYVKVNQGVKKNFLTP